MAKSWLVAANKKIEEAVVGAYMKIENGAVSGFNKIADAFVDDYLTKDGESVEDARKRLLNEEQVRREKSELDRKERETKQKVMIETSIERSRKAGRGYEEK
jgi:hypothetical protein